MEDINRKLVDEYDRLEKLKKDIENKLLNIKSEIINISKINNISLLSGTHKNVSVKEIDKVVYPEDKTPLTNLIKNAGLYEEFSHINYPRLSSSIIKKDTRINSDILNSIKIIKDYRLSLIDTGL